MPLQEDIELSGNETISEFRFMGDESGDNNFFHHNSPAQDDAYDEQSVENASVAVSAKEFPSGACANTAAAYEDQGSVPIDAGYIDVVRESERSHSMPFKRSREQPDGADGEYRRLAPLSFSPSSVKATLFAFHQSTPQSATTPARLTDTTPTSASTSSAHNQTSSRNLGTTDAGIAGVAGAGLLRNPGGAAGRNPFSKRGGSRGPSPGNPFAISAVPTASVWGISATQGAWRTTTAPAATMATATATSATAGIKARSKSAAEEEPSGAADEPGASARMKGAAGGLLSDAAAESVLASADEDDASAQHTPTINRSARQEFPPLSAKKRQHQHQYEYLRQQRALHSERQQQQQEGEEEEEGEGGSSSAFPMQTLAKQVRFANTPAEEFPPHPALPPTLTAAAAPHTPATVQHSSGARGAPSGQSQQRQEQQQQGSHQYPQSCSKGLEDETTPRALHRTQTHRSPATPMHGSRERPRPLTQAPDINIAPSVNESGIASGGGDSSAALPGATGAPRRGAAFSAMVSPDNEQLKRLPLQFPPGTSENPPHYQYLISPCTGRVQTHNQSSLAPCSQSQQTPQEKQQQQQQEKEQRYQLQVPAHRQSISPGLESSLSTDYSNVEVQQLCRDLNGRVAYATSALDSIQQKARSVRVQISDGAAYFTELALR